MRIDIIYLAIQLFQGDNSGQCTSSQCNHQIEIGKSQNGYSTSYAGKGYYLQFIKATAIPRLQGAMVAMPISPCLASHAGKATPIN